MELKRTSVFFKLIGITVMTGLLINVLLIFVLRGLLSPPAHSRSIVERNIHAYADQLAGDIGDPPDFAKAREISERTGLALHIEGPHGNYTSEPGLPQPNFQTREHREKQDRPYVTTRRGSSRLAFFLPERVRWDPGFEFLLVVLVLVTGLLVVSYFALRRLLEPLHDLAQGASSIGSGAIDHRVPVKSQDEFGRLAASFNEMSERIQQMMQAKERLLLDVSHELQSPLTRMKMALALLQDERGRERLQRDVNEMEKMVAEILESARMDSHPGALQTQSVDLVQLIREQVGRYQGQPPIHFQSSKPELWIEVDPTRFATVLRNLLDNALKHAEAEGQNIQVRLGENAQGLECTVRDFGRGIPAQDIPHLFEPFYRIDKSRSRKTGGYGLGLSLCDRIVRAHGGTIVVQSPVSGGRGTCFTVALPRPNDTARLKTFHAPSASV